jgi:hypothetical protein
MFSVPSNMVAATRASTLASTLDDSRGLFPFIAATTLQTVAANPDLRTRLALIEDLGDWRKFRPVYEEAERRRGKPEASEGTNIHSTVEALLAGRDVSGVDVATLRAAEGVIDALRALDLTPVASEEFTFTPGLREPVAGTRDLLCHVNGTEGLHIVVDIKSTSALDANAARYKGVAWAIQCALYARGVPYTDDFERDRWGRPRLDLGLLGVEERKVDTERAWVIEVERGSGRTATHYLDLDAGWRFAWLACEVRAARKSIPVIR